MVNTSVLNNLPAGQKTTEVYAYLIDFSLEARYQELVTSLTKLPDQQYLYTTGETHDFSNLLLISYSEEKSLESHLQKLKDALYADVEQKKYEPPLLYFVWGNYRFGTCRLTKVSGQRSLALTGEAAQVMLSISLVAVPKPETIGAETDSNPRNQSPPAAAQSTDTAVPTAVTAATDSEMEGVTTRAASTNDTLLVLPTSAKTKTINELVKQVRTTTQTTANPQRFRNVRYAYNADLKRVELFDRQNRLVGIATTKSNIKYAVITNLSDFERRYANSNS